MRRSTLITLAVLLTLLILAALVQLNQPQPTSPFEGPSSPGQLPSLTPAAG